MAEHAVINLINRHKLGKKVSINSLSAAREPSSAQPDSEAERSNDQPITLIELNVSGQHFSLCKQLANKYPSSKLANIEQLTSHYIPSQNRYYFDRDPTAFNAVLNLFRYDNCHKPEYIDLDLLQKELQFWQIPGDVIASYIENDIDKKLEREFQWLEGRVSPPKDMTKWQQLRYGMWYFMTDPTGPHSRYPTAAVVYAVIALLATIAYLTYYALGTSWLFRTFNDGVDRMSNETIEMKELADVCSTKAQCYTKTHTTMPQSHRIGFQIFFTVEHFIKVLLCPKKKLLIKSPSFWANTVATVSSITAIIRNIIVSENSVENSYVVLVLFSFQFLWILRVFEYISLIDGLAVMVLTIKASLKEIIILFIYLIMGMFIFSALVFTFEVTTSFNDGIPDMIYGFWWAIVTMTTVGYGDFYPVTLGGYIVGVICSLSGLVLTALPVAIIGSNFTVYWEHNTKRKVRKKESLNEQAKVKDQLGNSSKWVIEET